MRAMLLAVVLGWLYVPAVSAQAGAEALNAGIQAFRDNQLRRARSFFLTALSEGQQSGRLYYNLGVVHYRLGEYGTARQFFALAADYPAYEQVAHYNLARCAEKLALGQLAQRWYARAQAGADARVAALASRASARARQSAASNWALRLNWATGFDSSVVGLVDQVTSQPAGDGDIFYELSARARTGFDLSGLNSPLIGLSAYTLEYDSVEQAALQSAVLDLGDSRQGGWEGELSWTLHLAREWLNDEAYQGRLGLRGEWSHALGGAWFRHGLAIERISAASERAVGVDGWRLDLASAAYRRAFGGVVLARLAGQWNRRESPVNSPRRLGLELFWRGAVGDTWRLGPGLQWRWSDYSGGRAGEVRMRGLLRLEDDFSPQWTSRVEFQLERNWTDDTRYRYRHFRVLLGLSWHPVWGAQR